MVGQSSIGLVKGAAIVDSRGTGCMWSHAGRSPEHWRGTLAARGTPEAGNRVSTRGSSSVVRARDS